MLGRDVPHLRAKYVDSGKVRFKLIDGQNLGGDVVRTLGRDIGLTTEALDECVQSGRHAAAVDRDVAEAGRLGITGTPSFVVGVLRGDLVKGTLIVGAPSVALFEARIEELLEAPGR
jgi:predicted DsbA family dithiol-disulfide isomerase